MKAEERNVDDPSMTRRRFLTRAGKAGVGLASLAAVGPAIAAATSKTTQAAHLDEHACRNLTDLGEIIARVPAPVGNAGNPDIEVIRDGNKPPAGNADPWGQYDTFDGADRAAEDWIGYAYPSAHTFHQVVFQEGLHFDDGGWFESLTVQVRRSGTWAPVRGLSISPAYPFANDGVSYETYTLTFDEIAGDGIRIFGAPGGAADFISVGELEIFGDCDGLPSGDSTSPASQGCTNLTHDGEIIARVTSPTGGGNRNIEVIRDSDFPSVGSSDSSRQYDTFDGRNSAAEDWIGYAYPSEQTFNHVIFQEGLHFWNGGWFESLTVQVRQGGTWVPVRGLSISPAYPFADNGVSFETYSLAFNAIAGDGIRIIGAPGGSAGFISVGELEVFSGDCWQPSDHSPTNHSQSNQSRRLIHEPLAVPYRVAGPFASVVSGRLHRGVDLLVGENSGLLATLAGAARAHVSPTTSGGESKWLELDAKIRRIIKIGDNEFVRTEPVEIRYYHLNDWVGDFPRDVVQGEVIGLSGAGGLLDVPHCHFEVWTRRFGQMVPTDPYTLHPEWLRGEHTYLTADGRSYDD